MSKKRLIGIDIGTSGAKAVVIDQSGRLLAWAQHEYPILTPHPGWAEEDPQAWVRAAEDCVRQVVEQSGIDPRDVAGVGLTGQMHSLVCVDSNGAPVRPAIIWADTRSAAQVRALSASIGHKNLAAWTGNPLAAGFMLASWAWLKENEPNTVQATRWLMLPKDYMRYRLTGEIGSEPSDASSTLLFDPHLNSWSASVLDTVGLSVDRLPAILPSANVAGGLTPEAAAGCGLLVGTPVIYGGSDVSCQALAQGIVEPGTVSCTIGTGGQLFSPLVAPLHDSELRLHLFCHCIPGVWHQEAAILSAGLGLRWLRDQVFTGADYARLANAAAGAEAALDGLFFMPFLNGERTPHTNPDLRAGFLGLGLRHEQANITRSVMEGVIFALRQGLELMQSLGTRVDRLVASGGATRHPLWLKLQADIFDQPIYVSHMEEATARGAAMLAGIGSGLYQDSAEVIRQTVSEPVQGALPDPAQAGRYTLAYQEYVEWTQVMVDHYRVN